MQRIHIVIEEGTEQQLRRAENAPGQCTLQWKSHSPGVKPIRQLPVVDTLAHEIIDGIFECNEVVLQRFHHETHRRKGEEARDSYKKIRLEAIEKVSAFQTIEIVYSVVLLLRNRTHPKDSLTPGSFSSYHLPTNTGPANSSWPISRNIFQMSG